MPALIQAGGKLPSVVFRNVAIIGSNASSYDFDFSTFGGFGTVGSKRWMLVCFNATCLTATAGIPACTRIGTVTTPTLLLSNPATAIALAEYTQMWIAQVPDNSNEHIVFTRNANMVAGIISVWALYDLKNLGVQTDIDVSSQPGGSGTDSSATLDTVANCIAAAFGRSTSINDFVWTGLTEEYDAAGIGTVSTREYTAADKAKLPASSLVITLSKAGFHSFMAATFR